MLARSFMALHVATNRRRGSAASLRLRSRDDASNRARLYASLSSAARRRRGNLGDQLADHGLAEAVEIVDRQSERAGTADHVVLVVFEETAGRVGVQREIAPLLGSAAIEDGEAVDDH